MASTCICGSKEAITMPTTFVPPTEDETDDWPGVHVCDDCGAFAEKVEDIEHHATCKPGEAKRWEDFYAREENQT